ncbi:MAG: hypothetical protein JSW66_05035 [Phycisphaerales bacterium]|nr:MAG: hypothetical protein JSW66_05035 [Phycisphaerales bacterium]
MDFLVGWFCRPLSRVSDGVPRSAADGLFALIDVSAREPGLSCSERWRVAACLAAAETDGVLLVMKLPMRERDSLLPVRVWLFEMRDPTDEPRVCDLEVPAWPPVAMPDFATVGADGLVVPMEDPICLPEFVFVELERVPASLLKRDTEGVRAVIELPMRDVRPRLIRLVELLPGVLLDTDEDRGFVPLGLPIREVMPELIRRLELVLDPDTEGVRPVIELPMRDVRPRLIRLSELLLDTDEDDLFVPIELPIREVMLRLMPRLGPELTAEGVREVEPEIARLFELVVGPLPELDTEGACDVAVRLEGRLLRLRVDLSVLERDEIDVLGLIVLIELLRLVDVERLGGRIERELMLLLGLRLGVTVRDLEMEGALFADILLELVNRLGVRTERELMLLRLLLELADVLDLGAGADRETCVF